MVAKCYGCTLVWITEGVHDRASAVLKQSIRDEQMKMETPKLQITANVVALCLQRQAKEAKCAISTRTTRMLKETFYDIFT